MRVMVILKATPGSEAGEMPSEELLTAMGRYNQELMDAGILAGGEGLKPSSLGVRVHLSDDGPAVEYGPFSNTTSLVAGFWLWNVASMDEALAWAKRCPDPMPGERAELELRPLVEMEDFGEAMTPELREQEQRMRDELEGS